MMAGARSTPSHARDFQSTDRLADSPRQSTVDDLVILGCAILIRSRKSASRFERRSRRARLSPTRIGCCAGHPGGQSIRDRSSFPRKGAFTAISHRKLPADAFETATAIDTPVRIKWMGNPIPDKIERWQILSGRCSQIAANHHLSFCCL
jgi:hypothetical protein